MNAERRKRVGEAAAKLADARVALEEIRDDEQEAFDAMPESLQSSERGETIGAAIDTLQAIIDEIENSESELDALQAP